MIGRWLEPLSVHVVLTCRVAIVATGVHWLVIDDWLRSSVAGIALLLTYLPAYLLRDALLRGAAKLVVALLLAAHIVLGMNGGLYETSMVYDKWMHVIGSGALTAVLIVAALRYCDHHRVDLPLALLALLVLGGALAAGTLWEVFEFTVDQTGWFNAQRGLHDTMLDLVADAIGAAVVTTAYAVSASCRPTRKVG